MPAQASVLPNPKGQNKRCKYNLSSRFARSAAGEDAGGSRTPRQKLRYSSIVSYCKDILNFLNGVI
jgi:hypothetical protein